jgi:flagellar biosynthesis protein FliR
VLRAIRTAVIATMPWVAAALVPEDVRRGFSVTVFRITIPLLALAPFGGHSGVTRQSAWQRTRTGDRP